MRCFGADERARWRRDAARAPSFSCTRDIAANRLSFGFAVNNGDSDADGDNPAADSHARHAFAAQPQVRARTGGRESLRFRRRLRWLLRDNLRLAQRDLRHTHRHLGQRTGE